MGLRVVTPPVAEPLDLDYLKSHLRVDISSEDYLIEVWIAAARQEAERLMDEALITQTLELTLDRFPTGLQPLLLGRGPLQSIESIEYIDSTGTAQEFGTLEGSPAQVIEYRVIRDPERPRLALNPDYAWPIAAAVPDAVTIRFVAGYGDTGEDVPELTRAAMALAVGHFYQQRESTGSDRVAELPLGIRDLLKRPKVG